MKPKNPHPKEKNKRKNKTLHLETLKNDADEVRNHPELTPDYDNGPMNIKPPKAIVVICSSKMKKGHIDKQFKRFETATNL